MNRIRTYTLFFTPLLVIALSSSLFAFGFGLYGDFHGGKTWAAGTDHFAGGGGLVMDTNLAYDRVFNYRMELGAGYMSLGDVGDSLAINWVHYFGLGVVRTKTVRFWLGPLFTVVGLADGVTGIMGGMGFAMGVNINVGEHVSFCITGSGRFVGGYVADSVVYGADGLLTAAIIFRFAKDVNTNRY